MKRAGRMDRIVRFAPLDEQGRYKLAQRILCDDAMSRKMSHEYKDRPAAEFQEICCREAIDKYFSKRVNTADGSS